MRLPHHIRITSALLFLLASGGALAYHGGPSVVRPLHGFSLNYGHPVIHRYSHHYRPRHRYGSHFGYGSPYHRPYRYSRHGHYNDHRPYYYRHPFTRPYGGGSSLYFRF